MYATNYRKTKEEILNLYIAAPLGLKEDEQEDSTIGEKPEEMVWETKPEADQSHPPKIAKGW